MYGHVRYRIICTRYDRTSNCWQLHYSTIYMYIRHVVVVLVVGSSQVRIASTHGWASPSKSYGGIKLWVTDGGTSTGKKGAGTNGNN